METKYKIAVLLSIIPAIINIAGSVYLYLNFNSTDFMGYLLGTILGIILSVIWLLQVKKAAGSHAIKLLKITYKGFFIKFLVFAAFIAGVYYLVEFSRTWFVASFFIALSMGAVTELWFYSSIAKQK